ncbi:MAG: FAD-dependent oxidoreductase [Candidatus Latescibacterota bacterium]
MQNHYSMPARSVPVIADVDVVVVGGGFSGVCAAVAAARAGASVALTDRDGMLGGQAAEIYVFGINTILDREGNPFIRGLPWEIIQRTLAEGQSDPMWTGAEFERMAREGIPAVLGELGLDPSYDAYQYLNPNAFRYVLQTLMDEEGIIPFLESPLTDVMRDGDRVTGVVAQGNHGPFALAGKVVVDTTPHAGVAALSGRPFAHPDVYTGTHPRVAGVKIDQVIAYLCAHPDEAEFVGVVSHDPNTLTRLVARGIPLWMKGFRGVQEQAIRDDPIYEMLGYGDPPCLMFFYDRDACGSYWVHSTEWTPTKLDDPVHLSKTLAEMRKRQWVTHKLFRDYVPGFEQAHLMDVHPHIARALMISREPGGFTDYDLPWEAIEQGGNRYPDAIARIMGHPEKGQAADGFQLPYRCLLPKGLSGLLVTGKPACRFIHYHSTVAAVGQAAGVAGAIAAAEGVLPREVSVPKVQAELNRQGAVVF